jgi:hypothetical protein
MPWCARRISARCSRTTNTNPATSERRSDERLLRRQKVQQ